MADVEVLQQELDDLTLYFYISVAVLGCVLFLVGVLSLILYYWVYVLEKSVKKLTAERDEEADYKIRRPVLRDEPKVPSRQSDLLDPRLPQSSNQNQNGDSRAFKNPLTNNAYQHPPSVPFREQLQQQLQQNNPHNRYSNQSGFNDMKRNARQTEQQLHQNFYGVDNGNFRY